MSTHPVPVRRCHYCPRCGAPAAVFLARCGPGRALYRCAQRAHSFVDDHPRPLRRAEDAAKMRELGRYLALARRAAGARKA